VLGRLVSYRVLFLSSRQLLLKLSSVKPSIANFGLVSTAERSTLGTN
jgi:hypothetical protein